MRFLSLPPAITRRRALCRYLLRMPYAKKCYAHGAPIIEHIADAFDAPRFVDAASTP